jgi:ABC-2 type transporter
VAKVPAFDVIAGTAVAALGHTRQNRLQNPAVALVILDEDLRATIKATPHLKPPGCLPTKLREPARHRKASPHPQLAAAIMMPLFFSSSALYPTGIMPGWLQAISKVNPLTYEVEALRSLVGTSTTCGWTSPRWSAPRCPPSPRRRCCCPPGAVTHAERGSE